MSRADERPPVLAVWALRVMLNPADRDFMLGDLHEEYRARADTSVRAARRWYWREAATAVAPSVGRWRAARRRKRLVRGTHRGRPAMESWLADVRYAVRVLRRQPGFVAVSILTLGFGVGANAAIFSVVDTVLLRSLPFAEPERVVRVWGVNTPRGWAHSGVSWHDLLEWRRSVEGLSDIAAFNVQSGNLSGGDRAERVTYTLAESDLFGVLGVAPVIGRAYGPDEDSPGSDDVIVLAHTFWRSAFGGRAGVVGRTLELDGRPHVIVGVMPPGFEFPGPQVQAWKPFGMRPDDAGGRGSRWVNGVARLRAGVSLPEAQAELEAVTAVQARAHVETNQNWSARLEPMLDAAVGDARRMLYILWGAVGLVLLIACANIASLALARAAARHRELAVRSALGAGRWRLTRQLMTEQTIIAVAGGIFGIAVAAYAVRWLPALAGGQLPRVSVIEVDTSVIAYGMGVAVLAGLVSAIAPAWRVKSVGGAYALRARSGAGGHRAVRRWHDGLVTTEIALAIVVAVGAGLLARSFVQLMNVDPGFAIERRLTFRVSPSWNAAPERETAARFFRDLEERLARVPGVEGVGAVNRLPLSGNWWVASLTIDGRPRPEPGNELIANARVITPGYFDAMGIPVFGGRVPDATVGAGGPFVALVNESAVRNYWSAGTDPIGQRITLDDPDHPQARWFTIVGVVGDVRHNTLIAQPTPIVYSPFTQSRFGHFGDWGMDVVVAAGGRPENLVETVRGIVAQLDPTLPVYRVETVRDVIGRDVAERQFALVVLGFFAGVAVLLAVVGVYGVMSYSVVQRRPELSLRVALGAGRGTVMTLVVRHGLRLAGIGLIIGTGLSIASTTLLADLVYDVPTRDPLTMSLVALLLVTATVAACYVPARRAMRANPLAAMRDE